MTTTETRKFLHIDLPTRQINEEHLSGEQLVRAGRYLIARTLVESDLAGVDPLGPDNPLIFSAGPLAGTTFSNANRTSVGCKSPLTGGIKEANGGGTFSYALGQLHIAGLTLHGQADEWLLIHLSRDGAVTFEDAAPYLGRGNFAVAEMLHARYGNKTSLAICGPVGEYQGLLAGIAFSDSDRRPSRLAARGGVGAVMGSKRVKAIVVDMDKTPRLHDRKKVTGDIREYSRRLRNDPTVMEVYNAIGTMSMADYTNHVGAFPVRNFSLGALPESDDEPLKMGGDYIRAQNIARGGEHIHACMPGCVIQCSNVYADAEGREVVSPVEYETLGLLGTNCGVNEPDVLAGLNYIANDLGIDTIETGATLAVLMEAGLAEFGDAAFMADALMQIRNGTEQGRLWAQGTARVGEHYGVKRVPVIKKQAISAYDPRVIEVTGISMMTTAQGADHTVGNVAKIKTSDKGLEELMALSLEAQVFTAAADSLGICMFGRTVTNVSADFIAESINHALGTELQPPFLTELGRETLKLEAIFNRRAGFTTEDDDLPDMFYDEPLPPSNRVARFRGEDVRGIYQQL